MTAHTAFEHKLVRTRRHVAAAIAHLPLTERSWFRLIASAIIVIWVLTCAFTSASLAN